MFTRSEYRDLFEHVRAELIDTVFEVTKLVAEILSEAAALRKAIKKATSLSTMHAVSDVKGQLDNLVVPRIRGEYRVRSAGSPAALFEGRADTFDEAGTEPEPR